MFTIAGVGLSLAFAPGVIASAAADQSQSVRTQSGRVRCIIEVNDVGHGGGPVVACQTSGPDSRGFTQAPGSDTPGFHWNIATIRPLGAFSWMEGNIPGDRDALAGDIVMSYGQPYHVLGWTIAPSFEGTRFTNDGTGHGMFVSIDDVHPF
ncbi:hypothetical protein [Mycolicibacterium arenosum]|uniref:Secreted protein n=1 Tax=Mycolicibacterium arenosum TaxID=2952157 RepID=A0ABT1ME37_9MYCO|nr:hypothetical protein [Mycolicibacterium sp. CAU 1645]MCP9276840.1 hypothetical protein [Mycolicibacterium sp. CAU 1645]